MGGFAGRCTSRGSQRRSARRIAPVLLLGVMLTGCGSAGPARDSRVLTAAGWVQRGVSLFRSATSVLVLPEADGETFCAYVQPSCNAYTITQSPNDVLHSNRDAPRVRRQYAAERGGHRRHHRLPRMVRLADELRSFHGSHRRGRYLPARWHTPGMADLGVPQLRHQRVDAGHPNAGADTQASTVAPERRDPGTLSNHSARYPAPRNAAKNPGNDTSAEPAPAISLSSPS